MGKKRNKNGCYWRYLLPVIGVLWCILFGSKVQAEIIREFDADVRLNSDGMLDVVEIIKMDFENSKRHGIFRIIPIVYTRYGGNYSLAFRLIDVRDEGNRPINYIENSEGSDVNIRIGDSGKLLTGEHIYCLHYVVRRAVNFFENQPEIYWNGTGNDWPFTIEKATLRFYPPPGVNLSQVKSTCYVGPIGSTMLGQKYNTNKYIEFKTSNLSPGNGLTIVARLPAGSVIKPGAWQEFIWFARDWWGLFVIPTITAVWLGLILLPRVTDPDAHQAIAVEWNPPKDLSPAEVGTLVDESCDMQDIVSTLVDLAARGYLQIHEIEAPTFLFFSNKDYEFKRTNLNKEDDKLLPHEEEFLKALFPYGQSIKLSDLREKFYIHLPTIRQAIYQSLTDKKLFTENPDSVRSTWRFWAIILGVIGMCLLAGPNIPSHLSFGGGILISGIMAFIAGQFMPARTKAGWKERDQCLAFQRFVRLAEKDRIAVLAKDDPTIFGRLLPYAMVLGAADQWAEAFRGLLTQPPSWYVPYGYEGPNYTFSSRSFVHDLGQGMNTMGNTFTSAPVSTGSSAGSGGSGFSGGFSGGGFGGGGGGSW